MYKKDLDDLIDYIMKPKEVKSKQAKKNRQKKTGEIGGTGYKEEEVQE